MIVKDRWNLTVYCFYITEKNIVLYFNSSAIDNWFAIPLKNFSEIIA